MFSWGTGNLLQGDTRSTYLKAVKEADNDLLRSKLNLPDPKKRINQNTIVHQPMW
jgi:hypothetical protein